MTNFDHFRIHGIRFPAVRSAASLAVALALSVLLAACGGGGGGGDGASNSSSANATHSNASSPAAVTAPTPAVVFSGGDTSTTTATTGTAPASSAVVAGDDSTGTPSNGASSSNPAAPANGASPTSGTTPPTTPIPVAKPFYGVNGHNNEGGAYDISSPALQLSQLQDLGAKLYRNEVYSQGTATKLAGIAQTMAAGGVTVYPVMLMGIDIFNNETDAYNAGFALGQQTATSHRYPYYEVTNEMEAEVLVGNVDGIAPQDYDNVKFQKLRGVIRGMIAGIRSVDANGKIILGGGTWLHYGFAQMLAAGTQPDGTTGHPAVDWDITAWHWYSDQNDITNACGGSGCHNVLAALHAFGKPIWINEFGVRPNFGTDQQIAAYLIGNRMMAQFVALASTYDIESIQDYELYDDPVGGEGPYGLLQNDGATRKPAYNAYKNFVAANPM